MTLGSATLTFNNSGTLNVASNVTLTVSSVFNQDYQVVQSATLVIATIVIMVNLLVDISYGWFDPRIRYG